MSEAKYICAYGFLKSNGVSYFTMGKENSEKLRSFLMEKAKSDDDLVFNERLSTQPFETGSLTGMSSILNKPFNLKVVGDFYTSNGAYSGTRFTCEEYLDDAKAVHRDLSSENKKAMDHYYNNYRGS